MRTQRKPKQNATSLHVAQVIREVTTDLQRMIDAGQHSLQVDATDMIRLLSRIADKLDPPTKQEGSVSQSHR